MGLRLIEFLICLLEAHAQTLQRLAALFGEDVLFELLENAGDEMQQPDLEIHSKWLQAPGSAATGNPYGELESAVQDTQLAKILEFHLWAYPLYRAFVESSLDFNSRLREGVGTAMVEDAVKYAESWVKNLNLPSDFSQRAQAAAQVPWLRFRAEMLRKIGQRPLGPAV